MSIASPLMQPSPNGRRVGIRIVTFEACSGFTHVTARRIAQPPKATFVTRLRPSQLPGQAARQLPDLSTIIRVESSSTDDSRLRGALPLADLCSAAKRRTAGCQLGNRSAQTEKSSYFGLMPYRRGQDVCLFRVANPIDVGVSLQLCADADPNAPARLSVGGCDSGCDRCCGGNGPVQKYRGEGGGHSAA